MPRRVSLPSAEDLFRPTEDGEAAETAAPSSSTGTSAGRTRTVHAVPDPTETAAQRRPSGRVRHDEKMTVYVTAEELVGIETTRLSLRAGHGLAVDRGRLVREALALVLEEYDEHGAESALVRRLARG